MIKSLILMAFLACALVVVRADDNDGYPDYACDLCAAVIKDFTPELKSTVLQDYFDRLCDDITTDVPFYDSECKTANEASFEVVRLLLQGGSAPRDICKTLGACDVDQSFQKMLLQHFQKLNSGRLSRGLRMKKDRFERKMH